MERLKFTMQHLRETTIIHNYSQEYPENGLSFRTLCRLLYCAMRLSLNPTDLRYNGAQFTCICSLPECNTTNITDPTTVNIQGEHVAFMQIMSVTNSSCILYFFIGLLEAPTDVDVEADSRKNIRVSWRPPFTLDDVPILHYSVYVTNQGVSEQINTTETITLRQPCASTTYSISAWNEVGEGNTTTFGEKIFALKLSQLTPSVFPL